MKNQISVLVTGVGFGSLGRELIKAFQLAGKEYRIITADKSPKSFGLYETKDRYLIPGANSRNYIESLMKICKKENVKVLVSGSEPEIAKVSKNVKLFKEKNIEVLVNPWRVIKLCSDKYDLYKFLKAKNLSCPYTFLFRNESDIDKIQEYPVIIKPRIGSGSRNVFLAQDKIEVKFFTKYLKKYGSEPIVQEHVGNYEGEFTIGILYSANGELVTSIAMKRMLSAGLSTRQIIIDKKKGKKFVVSSAISQGLIDDFKEIRVLAEKYAQILKADGPINIQCRKIGKKILPFEINPRFSGTTGARSLIGHNEPDMLCKYKLFGKIPKKFSHKFGYVLRDMNEKFVSLNEISNIQKI